MSNQIYSTCLTDEQWDFIKHYFPEPNDFGRPREIQHRRLVNAILYLLQTGIQWRMMPKDFPNWKTVHHYFTAAGGKTVYGQAFMRFYGVPKEPEKVAGVSRVPVP